MLIKKRTEANREKAEKKLLKRKIEKEKGKRT
jgi:hypothetical protein